MDCPEWAHMCQELHVMKVMNARHSALIQPRWSFESEAESNVRVFAIHQHDLKARNIGLKVGGKPENRTPRPRFIERKRYPPRSKVDDIIRQLALQFDLGDVAPREASPKVPRDGLNVRDVLSSPTLKDQKHTPEELSLAVHRRS
jgi:hypothetical protein